MELRHIRYFLVLAEELNFSRAAERLYIAQPPLSRQIQELEKEIGAKLFHRTNRQVELTNAGKVFLKKAYHILDQVEQACISTRLSSTGKEGEFRIGFNGAIHDIIPTLKKYRELYPEVGIILKQMNATEQIEALNEKRIDIGTVTIPINNDKIQVMPLRKIHFMVAFPEKHPLALKESIYIRDMADETFIITPKSAGALYYDTFMSAFENADFTPKITIQAHDIHSVLTLVEAGMGITLTPTPTTQVNGIIKRKVEDINITLEASLAWRKDNGSEILKEFLKFFAGFDHNEILSVEN